MSQRIEITEIVLRRAASQQMVAVPGATAQVLDLRGQPLTVYQAETGAATFANPLTVDSESRIEGWVEAPDFDVAVTYGAVSYTQKIRLSPPGVYHVKSYGATGGDVADDYEAVKATIAAAKAAIVLTNTAATVEFSPRDTYYLGVAGALPGNDGGLKLPVGLTALLTLRFNGCGIKLSASTPRLFDIDRTADYQDFQHIHFEGPLDLDGGNVGGRHHVFVGMYQNAIFLSGKRLSTKDIQIKGGSGKIRVRNLLTDDDPALTNHRLGIALLCDHSSVSEATQNEISDVLIEDFECGDGVTGGGNSGVVIYGRQSSGGVVNANVFLDAITLRRVRWHRGFTPTASVGANGFHMGSGGHGGKLVMEDCYAYGAGDINYEINNFVNAHLIRCEGVDGIDNFAFINFTNDDIQGLESQVCIWDQCKAVRTAAAITPTGNFKGYKVGNSATNMKVGTVIVRDSTYYAAAIADFGGGAIAFRAQDSPLVDHIIFDNFKVQIEGIGATPITITKNPTLFGFKINGKVDFGPVDIELAGAVTISGGSLVGYLCSFLGTAHQMGGQGPIHVDLSRLTVSGGTGQIYLARFGEQAASTVGGEMTWHVVAAAGSGVDVRGFRFGTSANLTFNPDLTLRGDMTKLGVTHFVFDSDDQTVRSKVRTTDPRTTPLFMDSAGFLTFGNQASGPTEVSAARSRTRVNLSRYGQCRVVCAVGTLGNTATLRVQYSTDQTTWAYLNASGTSPRVALGGGTADIIREGNWVTIDEGAKGDVYLRAVAAGGDAAEDPTAYQVALQVQ